MRALTRVSLLAAALILLAGACQCLAAGGTTGANAQQTQRLAALKAASAAASQARLAAARKAVEEAELRLKTTQMGLLAARSRLEEGTVSQDDVSSQELAVAAAQTALAEAQANLAVLRAFGGGRVTLYLTDAGIKTALTKLFEGTGQSFVLDPNAAEGRPITVTLSNVEFEKALAALCEAAGLQSTERDGVWIITRRSDLATIAGLRLPVVGAMGVDNPMLPGDRPWNVQVPAWNQTGESRILRQLAGMDEPLELSALGASKHPSFKGEDNLIDLDVKDMPLSEVAAKLSRRVPPRKPGEPIRDIMDRSVEIVVDDSIKDLKVTAKIHKWPRGKVLDLLMDQANLACSKEDVPREPVSQEPSFLSAEAGLTRLYLVPRPELSVSGMRPRLPAAAPTPPGQH